MGDLRLAARLLWRSPVFAGACIALIAMGVAASTAAFSLIATALVRSPYPDADRLVVPFQLVPRSATGTVDTIPWSYQQALDLGRRVPSFESTAGFFTMFEETILLGPSGAERVVTQLVSPAYFDLLGAQPIRGRLIASADSGSFAARDVAVLSHELWMTRFSADPDVVGSVIRLNGAPLNVAGVARPGFRGLGSGADLWLPFEALRLLSPQMAPLLDDPLAVGGVTMVARLREGAMPADARPYVAATAAATGDLMPVPPGSPPAPKWDGQVTSLVEAQVHPQLRALLELLALAVAALLLIVSSNHASLLLARMRQRSRDASVRRALGASSGRLAIQTLVENLLPVGLGGLLGVAMAPLLINIVIARWPEPPFTIVLLRQTNLLRNQPPILDWQVLAFAVALILAVTVLVSLGPVWSITRSDPAEGLRDGRDRRRAFRAHGRRALVVGEITLATALLLAALLITQSLARLLQEDTGVQPAGVLTAGLNFSQAGDTPEARGQLAGELLQRLSAQPGVEAASLGTCMPLEAMTCGYSQRVRVDGQPVSVQGAPPVALQFVTPNYFQALGIPLLAGEGFTPRTGVEALPPAWIDEAFAKRYFGTRSPLGSRISTGAPEAVIVGVVKSVKQGDIASAPQGAVYYPLTQPSGSAPVQLFIRFQGATSFGMTEVRRIVQGVNPDIAVHSVRSMQDVVDGATANRRFVRDLLTVSALIGALLAVVGVYSVLAYLVAQTTREIGIRVALGATPSQVVWSTLREALGLVGLGLVIGGSLGYAGTGLLESFVYQMGRAEWQTYAAVSVLVAVSALTAAWIPARNAARLDASAALRHD